MITECTVCNARVDARVLSQYDVKDDLAPDIRFVFATCPTCNSPFLLRLVEGFMDWDGPERLYPPIDSSLSGRIPDSISHAFEEAQTCFRNRAFTAAVLMCRRAIESVAFEHMEEAGPLATR